MPLSASGEKNLMDVNAMSDHKAQVAVDVKLVSQNLQGPYAIKKRAAASPPIYSFDIPNPSDARNPQILAALTGMTENDCRDFIDANNTGNAAQLEKILKKNNLGEGLGQGGFRRSLETDSAYEARMKVQVALLKNTIDGGANVLSIQEQPYAGLDKRRSDIFARVMKDAGYVSVASQDQRDVGIWVKTDLASKSLKIDNTALGGNLVRSVTGSPLRGCAAEVDGVLCINLHADRATAQETVDALLDLRKKALDYAVSKVPPLKLSINGDMNLFQLDPAQKQRLEDGGFTLEKVKGQEKFPKPTYEAYFEDKALPKKMAHMAPPAEPPKQPILNSSSPLEAKWSALRSAAEMSAAAPASPKKGCFTQSSPQASNSVLSLKDIKECLQRGQIPMISEGKTALDGQIMGLKTVTLQTLKVFADLITQYSVKNIMGDLAIPVTVTMVDNPRAQNPKHDSTAMKIQFSSDAEAKIFAEKLFKEHGVHSLTLGPGVMKSPQNGAIYMTKADLEKVTAYSGLAQKVNSGDIAYSVMADSHKQSQTAGVEVKSNQEPQPHQPGFHSN